MLTAFGAAHDPKRLFHNICSRTAFEVISGYRSSRLICEHAGEQQIEHLVKVASSRNARGMAFHALE
jgi:hypothetical protein